MLAIGFVAAGLLNSCALAATAALFTLQALHGELARLPPHRPMLAALSSLGAGVVTIVLALALGTMALGAAIGWWPLTGDTPMLVGAWMAGLFVANRISCPGRWLMPSSALALGALTLVASHAGLPHAQCIHATVVAVLLVRHGWHLMHDITGEALRHG